MWKKRQRKTAIRLCCVLLLAASACAQDRRIAADTQPICAAKGKVIHASRLRTKLAPGEFPQGKEWQRAAPIVFCSHWHGKGADPHRSTEVRILWSDTALYLRFRCKYRELFTYGAANSSGRKEHLWERDVAEAFLQPDRFGEHFYKEFEVSPDGLWLDLDVFASGDTDLHSGMRALADVNPALRVWTAGVVIPMKSITTRFDPNSTWRANFFRVERREPNRAYLAWRPTHTPTPDFHKPEAFGLLRFDQ